VSTSAISPTAGSPPAAAPAAPPPIDASSLANQNVFLQLLVAQLKNQDPEHPADGTPFVTQLAQFTTLEQTTQSRGDLDQILKTLQTTGAAAANPPPADPSPDPVAAAAAATN
jgi:flagellar basal-body rod modification protein FlgD